MSSGILATTNVASTSLYCKNFTTAATLYATLTVLTYDLEESKQKQTNQ